MERINIGDTIEFKTLTLWNSSKAKRKVVALFHEQPCVRFGGWSKFVVRLEEVIKVIPKNN